jgi:hypothetical protein
MNLSGGGIHRGGGRGSGKSLWKTPEWFNRPEMVQKKTPLDWGCWTIGRFGRIFLARARDKKAGKHKNNTDMSILYK